MGLQSLPRTTDKREPGIPRLYTKHVLRAFRAILKPYFPFNEKLCGQSKLGACIALQGLTAICRILSRFKGLFLI